MAQLRSYRPSDRCDVAEICLRTGNEGADATGMFVSDDLLADIFALPYVEFDPDLAFVVAGSETNSGESDNGEAGAGTSPARERASGYVLATADTRAFIEQYRRDWLPEFAQRYTRVRPPVTRSDEFVEIGYTPDRMLIPELETHPAHLHIDLLPELQGQGFGRQLVRTLLAALRDRGVPGVHLGVSPRNTNAQAFYRKLGFRPLPSDAGVGSLLGISTDAVV